MNNKTKEKLIMEWKQLRGNFFNLYKEDKIKFEKSHKKNPLYPSVIKHFDKSFTQVNQLAESEINILLNTNKEK